MVYLQFRAPVAVLVVAFLLGGGGIREQATLSAGVVYIRVGQALAQTLGHQRRICLPDLFHLDARITAALYRHYFSYSY